MSAPGKPNTSPEESPPLTPTHEPERVPGASSWQGGPLPFPPGDGAVLADLQRRLYRTLAFPEDSSLLNPIAIGPTGLAYFVLCVIDVVRALGLNGLPVPGEERVHSVVGMLAEYTLGVRHYAGSVDMCIAIEEVLRDRMPSWMQLVLVDEPACVMHDDCAALEELGRACWRHHHPHGWR